MIGEYNTQRPHIKLKEYGRNVQKLVEYIRSVPDKEKRTELAFTLVWPLSHAQCKRGHTGKSATHVG